VDSETNQSSPKLSATELVAEIEDRLHKRVNAERVRRELRKNDLH
jgi:hypothetical protein